jgi:hypothetical protein
MVGETGLATITPMVGGLVSPTIDDASLVPVIVTSTVRSTVPPWRHPA